MLASGVQHNDLIFVCIENYHHSNQLFPFTVVVRTSKIYSLSNSFQLRSPAGPHAVPTGSEAVYS